MTNENAIEGHSNKMENRRVGQSSCAVCGKTVRPGGGIVLWYGKGGRVHIECQNKEITKQAEEISKRNKL